MLEKWAKKFGFSTVEELMEAIEKCEIGMFDRRFDRHPKPLAGQWYRDEPDEDAPP